MASITEAPCPWGVRYLAALHSVTRDTMGVLGTETVPKLQQTEDHLVAHVTEKSGVINFRYR